MRIFTLRISSPPPNAFSNQTPIQEDRPVSPRFVPRTKHYLKHGEVQIFFNTCNPNFASSIQHTPSNARAPSSTLPLSSTPTHSLMATTVPPVPSKLQAPQLGTNKKFSTTAFYHHTCARGHDTGRVPVKSPTISQHSHGRRSPKPELARVEVVVKAFRLFGA